MEVKNILFLGGAKRVAMARLFKEAAALRSISSDMSLTGVYPWPVRGRL